MNMKFKMTNPADKMNKERAEKTLEHAGFFAAGDNRKAFDRGEIEVYIERFALEAIMILDKQTGQMACIDLNG